MRGVPAFLRVGISFASTMQIGAAVLLALLVHIEPAWKGNCLWIGMALVGVMTLAGQFIPFLIFWAPLWNASAILLVVILEVRFSLPSVPVQVFLVLLLVASVFNLVALPAQMVMNKRREAVLKSKPHRPAASNS